MKPGGDPYKYFRIEAREILDGLTRGLLDLEKQGGESEELIGECFRLAHTLKGAARVTFWGALALLVTAGIGRLFGTVV